MGIFKLLSIIVVCMLIFIIYQHRRDSFNPQMYLKGLSQLVLIFFNYFKDVGLCAAIKFREINWDLSTNKKGS